MNKDNDQNLDDADLAGFETPEAEFDTAETEQVDVDDADFQDVSADEIDADVFGEQPPSDQPQKKKVNWFNIGVAVVAVAIAGGLIWSKLGPQLMGVGASSQQMVSTPVAAGGPLLTKADSEAAAQAALNTSSQNSVGPALLDNPDQLATLNQGGSATPEPTPNGLTADPFASLGNTAVSQVTDAVPMPAPISGTPEPQPIAVAETGDVPFAAAPAVAVAPSIEAQPAVAEQRVMAEPVVGGPDNTSQLREQVATLEQKLEAMDSKLTAALEQMTSVQPVSAPVDDARLSGIQSALERLEARLDDISAKKAVPQQVSDTRDVAPAPKKSVKKKSKPKAKAVQASASSKWDAPYNPDMAEPVDVVDDSVIMPARVSASSGRGSGWQLRGAQTGRAVIARGSDLREIGIGETVNGLGEITGIATVNGRWVVQGTQGRISQ